MEDKDMVAEATIDPMLTIARLRAEIDELTGRCTCVWCGQAYHLGPTQEECIVSMKAHMEECKQHPIHALRSENTELRQALERIANLDLFTFGVAVQIAREALSDRHE